MAKARISSNPKDFDDYITSTDDNLQLTDPPTTATRFGWTSGNVSDWHDYRVEWEEDVYPPYKVKKNRSTTVRDRVKEFIANFRLFGNPLLDKAAASSGATIEDASMFNFKIGRANPTHQNAPMTASVYSLVTAIGGGEAVIRNRTASDATRSRIPRELGADSVQIAYCVDRVPAKPEDGTQKEVTTKAKFTLSLGASSAPRKLYGFSRWYNTKNPKISGPWSAMWSSDIL